MSYSHVALTARNTEKGFAVLAKSAFADTWQVLSVTPAFGPVYVEAELLALLKQHPHADFSFSTRAATDFSIEAGETLGAEPVEGLQKILPGHSLTVLCKEGNQIEPEAWASIWRSQTGALVCSGLPGRFMSQTIPDKVREWLAFEGHRKLDRPLELWIRRGGEWNARSLLPDRFPPVRDTRPDPAVAADRAAKFKKVAAHDARVASAARERASLEASKKAEAEWRKQRLARGGAS